MSGGRHRAERLAVGILLLALTSGAVRGAGTRTWVETPDDLARGSSEGMALTREGRLFLAPRLSPLDASAAGPGQVWDMASDPLGNLYLGTGPDGQLLRIGRTGAGTVPFAASEPMISALAVRDDGRLLLAANPGGSIYRIGRDGSSERWVELEDRYVWSLAIGPDGAVYAGTGERGRIFKIRENGSAELFFDTDESHVVSLRALADGSLLAGGAGRGLVYRIDEEGHALVLHDDDLPEVVALDVTPDGAVVAALVGPPETERKRPALEIRLPDGVQVGTTDEAVGSLEESSGPTLRGTIEGLAPAQERKPDRARGRIVRIDPSGSTREVWSSTREVPFCVVTAGDGTFLFGTGEPARLYRTEPDGDVALLATLPEAQLTAIHRAGANVHVATSNPVAAYRLERDIVDSGAFHSRAFDTGGPSRWGTIRWKTEHPSGRTELYTRTGNSREPDDTWSAWSPAMIDAGGSPVVNPDGRFVQWRVRQVGSLEGTRLSDVAVSYEPYNRPPELREFRRGGATSAGEPAVLRWSVRDPDGDRVEVRLEYRPLGADGWAVAGTTRIETGDGWQPGTFYWSTTDLAEGVYELRAVASDQPANPRGDGLAAASPPSLEIFVDRTPPVIEQRVAADGMLELRVSDEHSRIVRLEWIRDGEVRSTARPDDGVCDSAAERFRLSRPEGEGWSLRGVDAAGNVVERPLDGEQAADSEE